MSTYKQNILDLGPKLFMTFDGDFFDPTSRRLISEVAPKILDESGEGNDGDLILDNPTYVSYRLGDPSLVELEPDENYSMTIGEYVPLPFHPSIWAKNFISIPHSSSFQFPDNGSYSLGFLYRKEQRDTIFINWLDETYPGDLYCGTSSPIIRKGLVLEITHEDNQCFGNNVNQLRFKYLRAPDGLTQQEFVYSFGTTTEGLANMQDNNHFFLTWDVRPTSGALFVGTMTIYHNAKIVHQNSFNYFSAPPVTNVSSPWELFGTGAAGGDTLIDRCKSPTTLDQLCVFDYALSHDEVSTLFKKTRTYKRLVITQGADRFYAMEDFDEAGTVVMADIVGGIDGEYFGISEGKVGRRFDGPSRIPESYSVQFTNSGMAFVEERYPNHANFTIDGWFKTSFIKRGLMIGQSSDSKPYYGWSLFLNQADGEEKFGRVQLTASEDKYINSIEFRDDALTTIYYNDDQDHYFMIRKIGDTMELWLDNIKQGELDISGLEVTGTDAGISFMGLRPGDMWVNGQLSLISMNNFALSDANARARYSYGLTWRITGTTTLQGTPHPATLRAYRYRTGELLQEIEADPGTGFYMLRLFDGGWVTVIASDQQDPNVRPRVFGPIVPRVHEDPPVL